MSFYKASDLSLAEAQEMAMVGIIPSLNSVAIGKRVVIAGQPFTIVADSIREEFLERVASVGLELSVFQEVPLDLYFYKVATD